ncbi:MAG: hypothetical protein KF738_17885, partial [Burkholderiales bacterium]|nr:hypothetical protein [Burkholderiales bacterium]
MHELPGSAPVARTLAAAAMLAASIAAQGAELDLAPDAVLGKPTFTTAAGGAASAANLIGPGQAAEDPVEGTLWVVDTAAHRVLRFGSAAAFANGEAANLVLGQPDFTSSAANRGGLPAANALSAPVGIAVDQAGRVYVAEDGNHRILVFRPPYANGMEAFAVIGQADFASASANRGGTKGGNTLAHPRQLAVNDVGDLFVADSGNDRVLRFTAPAVTGAAASRMIEASGHGTAPAAGAALSAPQGVAIGASGGDIWVADTGNNRVIRFPGLVAGPATIVLCQPDFAGVAAGTGAGACSSPASVAVDLTGVVYVGDSQNSRVLRFATPAVGAFATGVMGQPDFASSACNAGAGVAASTLCNPAGVAVNRDGHVLVVDGGNARVLRHDLPGPRAEPGMSEISPAAMPVGGGAFTLTVNGLRFHGGSAVHWNGVALATRYLSGQRLVAQVPAGHIASAGPHSVTVVTPGPGGGASPSKQLATYARSALDNAADRVLGQYDFGPVWSPASQWLGEERLGSANAAQISGKPVHAAIDPHSGRLFVASLLEARVLSWPSAAAFHNGQAADVILGTPDEFTTGPGPRPADLCGPVGLAVGGGGVLFVSDSACNRILAWSPPFVTGMAPSRVFGQGGSFTSILPNNGGISADSLATPLGLAATGTALIVHDSGNARLLVYDDPMADTTADTVIGQAGMDSGALAPPGATRISAGGGGGAVPGSQQGGLALDRMGRIYFADGAANRIIRFSPPFSNGMAADLVIGQQDFLSSTAGTTGTTLDGPVGIALDPAGSLLVADQSNHRVLRFAAPLQTGMAATGVLGQPDFSSRLVGSGPASLNGPTGLAADRLGNIFVVDAGERLLAFDRPFALPAVRGDADDDRKADLFWRESSGGLSWWTMNGATATAANYHDVDPAWQI